MYRNRGSDSMRGMARSEQSVGWSRYLLAVLMSHLWRTQSSSLLQRCMGWIPGERGSLLSHVYAR